MNVAGAICTDTVWHQTDSPFIVTGSVFVGGTTFCSGTGAQATLTIEPGVEVRFSPSNKVLDVSGTLIARGTAASQIHFTTNRNPPAAGDWLGIRFEDASKDATYDAGGNYTGGSIIEFATIEYATDTGGTGVIQGYPAAPFLKDLTIQNCNPSYGVYLFETDNATVRLRNVDVLSNTASSGVYVYTNGLVDLNGLTVMNNTLNGNGVYVHSNNSASTVSQVAVTNNSGPGTGISISSSSTATVSDILVSGNGGAGATMNSVLLQRPSITGNAGTGLNTSNTTVLDALVFGNGGDGIDAYGSSIMGSCISSNDGPGLSLISTVSTVLQTTIVNNVSDGIGFAAFSKGNVNIQQSNLIQTAPVGQNGPYVIRNTLPAGSAAVVATNDWWGTTDPSTIENLILHCIDDGTLGCVQTAPIAQGPTTGAPDIAACTAGTLSFGTTSTTTSTSTTITTSTTTTTKTTTTTTTTPTTTTTTASTTTTPATTTTTSSTTTITDAGTTTITSSTSTSSTVLGTTTTTPTTNTSSSSTTSTSTSSTTTVTEITSTTTSSTTSTTSLCGNGQLDPGEQCDPGATTSANAECCSRSCLIIRIGLQCGSRTPGLCEEHDTCDGGGRCASKLRDTTYVCRQPFTNGICDAGDNCDGISPDCPDTGQCSADADLSPSTGTKVDVLCQVPKAIAGNGSGLKCATEGFLSSGTSPRSIRAADTSDTTCIPTVKALTPSVSVPLKSSSDPNFLQKKVTLGLNPLARRLLRKRGSLEMCVRLNIKLRGKVIFSRFKPVTIRP